MPVSICWIGHASFRLSSADTVVYIDPWKLPDAPHDADVVFVSHSHYDHCSPEDIEKVSRESTSLVAPPETIEKLGAANAVTPGDSVTIQGVLVEAVASYNVNRAFHPRANNWVGAVFTLGGRRIYYAGDTDLIPEMNDLHDVDVALLPVGGTYTLDAAQAARACQTIGPARAVPYHWGDIVGGREDADAFARAATNCEVTVLSPGESLEIS